jgi:hypothetical protein
MYTLDVVALALVVLSLTGNPSATIDCDGGHGMLLGYATGAPLAHISLTTEACRGARRGDFEATFLFLHEIGHVVRGPDEHGADCYALETMKSALRRFWRASRARANAGYRFAVAENAQHLSYGNNYGCPRLP